MLELCEIIKKIKLFELLETNLQIAEVLGVQVETVWTWEKNHCHTPPTRAILHYLVSYCLKRGIDIVEFMTAPIEKKTQETSWK